MSNKKFGLNLNNVMDYGKLSLYSNTRTPNVLVLTYWNWEQSVSFVYMPN